MAIQWRDQPIIDSVQLPGSSTKYWVVDKEAREKIETLIGATRFMGVTTTELTDGATTNPITINDETYTAGVGDIVIYTPNESASLEFIWDGTRWQLLGGQIIEGLGALAYKDSATGSFIPNVQRNGGVTVSSKTLAASAIPLTLSTVAVTGATSFKTINTSTSAKAAVTVTYSKLTSATTTVNSSATFTGVITNGVTGVTGGTGTKNTATTLALAEATGGVTLVTGIPSTATATGGAATVGAATVYGLAKSTTNYMTGAETLDKKSATVLTSVTATTNANEFTASVVDGVLTFATAAGSVSTVTVGSTSVLSYTTGITAGGSATATTYTVGKSGATTFTQPTISIGAATTKNYKVSVPANTFITSVTAAEATLGDIDIQVSGAAVTTSGISLTHTPTDATGSTDSNVITGLTTSTVYGTVSAYAGGSHDHDVTDTLTVTGTTTSVTVS